MAQWFNKMLGALSGQGGSREYARQLLQAHLPVTVHQDVDVYAGRLSPGTPVVQALHPDRHAWIHVASGRARLNDQPLETGDGAAISGESSLRLAATEPTEVLIFDLA